MVNRIGASITVERTWCDEYANTHSPMEKAPADMMSEIRGISVIHLDTHTGVRFNGDLLKKR